MDKIIGRISEIMAEELEDTRNLAGVEDVRILGAIGVIETKTPVNVGEFQRYCVQRGIWVRPFGKNVYIMPPYVISEDELRKLCREMIAILRNDLKI